MRARVRDECRVRGVRRLLVSLGGGGTDLPSYYRDSGDFLVSGAIHKYVYMLSMLYSNAVIG